jgi:hypothetical protein
MKCNTCGSANQREFSGEVALHFPGLKGVDKPIVWMFPRILVCLNCGHSVFTVPETQLRALAETE